MKHHFKPWAERLADEADRSKLGIMPYESHSECTRCGVKVKYPPKQATMKYLVGGQWVTKRPPCTGGKGSK